MLLRSSIGFLYRLSHYQKFMYTLTLRYYQITCPFRRYKENETVQDDWNVPIISEETLDKLTTMFTIYPE